MTIPSKKVQSLDELFDVTAETDVLWDAALKTFQRLSRVYGFHRCETPLLEDLGLYRNFYQQDEQELAAVISWEISNRAVAVRPALLPSVLRSFSQGKMFEKSTASKWSYAGMTVRRDPRRGKLNQDMEFGFEVFGEFDHLTEAQVMSAVWELLSGFGLEGLLLEINHVGTGESQAVYQEAVQDFFASKKYQLCDICNEQLDGRVLNVFRCDNLDCQAIAAEAPVVLDFLDEQSHAHFTNILEALDEVGIPYQLAPAFFGPAGYQKTNFAIKVKNKTGYRLVGEGGYHDGLLSSISNKHVTCFGFSGSLATVRELLEQSRVETVRDQKSDVFLVPLGELAAKKSLRLFRDLTHEKVIVYDHFGNSGVKNQLKQATENKAPIALIMGQKEAANEMVILRDLKSGMQEIIPYDKIVVEVKKRLGK